MELKEIPLLKSPPINEKSAIKYVNIDTSLFIMICLASNTNNDILIEKDNEYALQLSIYCHSSMKSTTPHNRIDLNRFENDSEYRCLAILSLFMCNDSSFEYGEQLAIKYNISIGNSTTEITTLQSLCRSQVRMKEECWVEGVQIPPPVKRKRRKKPTMNGYNQTPYRLGRRPGKQGPRPLPGNQGRVEKLATGKTDVMTRTKDTNRGTGVTTIKTNDGAQRLKITKDIFTVGTWNVQTLWTTGKLELLRNEMKRFRFDVVGISEVRW
ncbi:unnamed protein product, partial [Rotaria socialis]